MHVDSPDALESAEACPALALALAPDVTVAPPESEDETRIDIPFFVQILCHG